MSRRPIIAGNWKMYTTVSEGLALATGVRDRTARVRGVDVVVGPPALALHPICQRLSDSNVGVAAQNCHWAEQGAFTGELAPPALKDVGCRYVIIGHSERRQMFGETDEGVAKKARSLHDHGLTPILCVGETLEQREAGRTMAVVLQQVTAGLAELTHDEISATVLAYEPVWAIGTGRTASPEQAQEVHATIRERVASVSSAAVAEKVRIQYGGSVKPANIKELMAKPDIDGALVGGASLTAESFAAIVAYDHKD